MPSQKIGTLSEIARLTGLSKASVNAALSGRGGNTRVSADTIRRVKEAAKQLNYRSNSGARALRSNSFNNIGFILVNKEACDYSYSDFVMEGITSSATKHGQNVFINRVPTSLDFSQKVPRTLKEACLDGLIVQDGVNLTPEFVEIVESCGVPVVYLNEKRPTNSVYVNDVATGRVMTKYLLGKGFRRIAYLSSAVRVPHYSAADRIEGYRSTMEEAGLPSLVKRFTSPWEDQAAEWLKSGDLPEVIYCNTDEIALRVQRILYAMDIKVPRDIAIAGCDDEIIASHSPVPLTTMRIPFFEMARLSVDMLMKLISYSKESDTPAFVPSVALDATLTERLSTARPPADC